MNQLFEFAVCNSNTAAEAWNKLFGVTNGFTTMNVQTCIELQRWYLYNSKSVCTTKLIEMMCLDGKLPFYDPNIFNIVHSKDQQFYHNLFDNAIMNLIYFDLCNYEVSRLKDIEVNFLAGIAKDRRTLCEYLESSIDNFVDNSKVLEVLNETDRDTFVADIKSVVRNNFLYLEFDIKGIHEPLNLTNNAKLHTDIAYYLVDLYRRYNLILFVHPYYFTLEEFIDGIMDDIQLGIHYGVMEYYLDDNERRSNYDEEIEAFIYIYLNACMYR